MVLYISSAKLAFVATMRESRESHILFKLVDTSFMCSLRGDKKVIHKLSTLLTKIGLKDSFRIGLRSVTMKWGKVGDFGEIIVWR